MKREDVKHHRDGYGPSHPAINVKVHRRLEWPIAEHFKLDEGTAAQVSELAWDAACREFWGAWDAVFVSKWLGQPVKVYSEGRSNGWLAVHDLPDIDEWDADLLAKWAELETAVLDHVKDRLSWDNVKSLITDYGLIEVAKGPRCPHCREYL